VDIWRGYLWTRGSIGVRPKSAGAGWLVVFVVGVNVQAVDGQVQKMAGPTDPDNGQQAHLGAPAVARGGQIIPHFTTSHPDTCKILTPVVAFSPNFGA
jgi:hypothetical protein